MTLVEFAPLLERYFNIHAFINDNKQKADTQAQFKFLKYLFSFEVTTLR
jgi:hypothetical protein